MEIRVARREDLEQTLAIYNYEVENGVATFDLHPKTAAEWEDGLTPQCEESSPSGGGAGGESAGLCQPLLLPVEGGL